MAHSHRARYPTSKGRSRACLCLTLMMGLFIGGVRREDVLRPYFTVHTALWCPGVRSSEGICCCAWEGTHHQHDCICPPLSRVVMI